MALSIEATTSDELRRSINRKGRMLAVFSGEWCPDCQQFEPVLRRWMSATRSGVRVFRVEVARDCDEWDKWSLDEIPTVAAYSDGKEHGRVHGTISVQDLQSLVNKIA